MCSFGAFSSHIHKYIYIYIYVYIYIYILFICLTLNTFFLLCIDIQKFRKFFFIRKKDKNLSKFDRMLLLLFNELLCYVIDS